MWKSIKRHKGFYFCLFLILVFYESSSWFVEKWFAKQEARDVAWLDRQKVAERIAIDKVQLKVKLPLMERVNKGNPSKSLEKIFEDAVKQILTTQEFTDDTKAELEDFVAFKMNHQENPLSENDMRKIKSGILKLINFYSSQVWPNQHPNLKDANIQKLKELVGFHKNTAMIVFGIDNENYSQHYPSFYSFDLAEVPQIESGLLFEHKLKSKGHDYYLRVGGDILENEYIRNHNGMGMPQFIARNVSPENQYIINILKKGKKDEK